MLRIPLTPALLSGLILLSGCGSLAHDDVRPMQRGDAAPSYTASTLDGERISVSALKGEVIVVYYWATWCKPCEKTLPGLERLHERYAAEGLRIVGIHVPGEPPSRIRSFLTEYQVTFPIILDKPDRSRRAFRWTMGVPQTVVIDRNGRVAGHWKGLFDPDDFSYEFMLQELLRGT